MMLLAFSMVCIGLGIFGIMFPDPPEITAEEAYAWALIVIGIMGALVYGTILAERKP